MTTIPSTLVTEKDFQQTLLDLFAVHGWRCWHNTIAWRSDHGWPDLVCCHPRWGILFCEVKRQEGKLTPTQESWLADLTRAGARCYVLKPADWPLAERIARGAA